MYEVNEFLNHYFVVNVFHIGYEDKGKRVLALCTRNSDAEAIVAALKQVAEPDKACPPCTCQDVPMSLCAPGQRMLYVNNSCPQHGARLFT